MSVVKNTSIYFGTNVLVKGLVFLNWFYVARIVSLEAIAQYTLALFVIEFLGHFVLFGSGSAIVIEYAGVQEKSIFSAINVVNLAFMILIVLFLTTSGILQAAINHFSLESYQFIKTDAFLIFIWIYLFSSNKLTGQYFVAAQKATAFSRLQMSQSVIFLMLILVLQFFMHDFYLLALARIGSLSGSLAWAIKQEGFHRRFIHSLIDGFGHFKNSVRTGFPFFLRNMIGVVGFYLSRILLDRFVAIELVGVYSFFFMIIHHINMLIASFDNAYLPKMIERFSVSIKDNLHMVTHVIKGFSLVFLFSFSILLWFDHTKLLSFILTGKYFPYMSIFEILAVQIYFSGVVIFLRPLYYFNKKVGLIAFFSFVLFIINWVVNITFIKFWGLKGAALGTVLLAMIQMFLFLLCEKEYVRSCKSQIGDIGIVSFLLCGFLAGYQFGLIKVGFAGAVTALTIIYARINRNSIGTLYRMGSIRLFPIKRHFQ